jgi:Icc-related predicted phosphoesterase
MRRSARSSVDSHPATIVLIGDVHDEIGRLGRTLALVRERRLDLALLAGDIGLDPPWNRALRRTRRAEHDESVRRVVSLVRSACGCPVVFVPGNHDLDDPPEDVPGLNVDRRIVEVGGLRIAGFGGAGPTPFGFPYEWSEDEAAAALERLLADETTVDVFLSHAPPSNTDLDRTARGACVGSPAVKRWIACSRPRLFVCGHIHEAWGVEWLDGVPCVNAGALGPPRGRDLVWIVEWADGPERIRSFCRDAAGRVERRSWERS